MGAAGRRKVLCLPFPYGGGTAGLGKCHRMGAEGVGGRYCESSSQCLTVGLESHC